MPKQDERILRLFWSKKEKDLMVQYPRSCDGSLIMHHFTDMLVFGGIDGKEKGWLNYKEFNLVKELISRGYDITTIKFEIKLKE